MNKPPINPDFDPNAALKVLREIRRESDAKGYLPDAEAVNQLVTTFGDMDDWLSNRGRLPAPWLRITDDPDWTTGPTGRSNSSVKFVELAEEIGRMIRDNANPLLRGQSDDVGRSILARLVHVYGLAPGAGAGK